MGRNVGSRRLNEFFSSSIKRDLQNVILFITDLCEMRSLNICYNSTLTGKMPIRVIAQYKAFFFRYSIKYRSIIKFKHE